MSDQPARTIPYEPPKVTELGTVHELTQICSKAYGPTDGFQFNGQGLTTTSCST
jgi:hypothetical protein